MSKRRETCLREQFLNHASGFDARQTIIQSLRFERESLVVDSKQVKDRGVEIADVHRILDNVVAEVVRFP